MTPALLPGIPSKLCSPIRELNSSEDPSPRNAKPPGGSGGHHNVCEEASHSLNNRDLASRSRFCKPLLTRDTIVRCQSCFPPGCSHTSQGSPPCVTSLIVYRSFPNSIRQRLRPRPVPLIRCGLGAPQSLFALLPCPKRMRPSCIGKPRNLSAKQESPANRTGMWGETA